MQDDCKTRYPLFLVHGTGFRDRKHLNYWGRIPAMLQGQGATVYYGRQDSWATVEDNAAVLAASLDAALEASGSEKVNIIAHSKGGVEARHLITALGYSGKVASLTTISSPHHGSKTMDWLLRLPKPLFRIAGVFVNTFSRIIGDKKPDFFKASREFSTAHMQQFNVQTPDAAGVYYQSCASAMKRARSDILMWLPYLVVRRFDGENDGLVGAESAKWGHFMGVWRGAANRGISHIDAVDLRRPLTKKPGGEGISDVPQAYVQLVAGLKRMGF